MIIALDAQEPGVAPGRTVSVLDVSYTDIRPPRAGVVAVGELAVDRLG